MGRLSLPFYFMKVVSFISRLILGLIFIVSAVLKFISLDEFGLYIYSFEFLSFDFSSLAARVLVIFEFLLGVFILTFSYLKLINLTTLITIILFSTFLLWRILVGDTDSCHCFGTVVDMNPTESLIKNVVILLFLGLGWKVPQWKPRKLILGLITLVVPILVFAFSPPDFYFRLFSSSDEDLIEEKLTQQLEYNQLTSGRKLLCFYSTFCPHCKTASMKTSLIIQKHSLPLTQIHAFFMGTEETRSDVETFFEEYGRSIQLNYTILEPLVFIDMTSGSMPIYALVEDGKLVKEYDYLSIDESEVIEFLTSN